MQQYDRLTSLEYKDHWYIHGIHLYNETIDRHKGGLIAECYLYIYYMLGLVRKNRPDVIYTIFVLFPHFEGCLNTQVVVSVLLQCSITHINSVRCS